MDVFIYAVVCVCLYEMDEITSGGVFQTICVLVSPLRRRVCVDGILDLDLSRFSLLLIKVGFI